MAEGDPAEGRTFAEKLNRLFRTVHPRGRGPYSNEEVADAIREAGGHTISASYLWLLRNGRRPNPTKRHLEALAAFFGVPPSYFFDEADSAEISEQLELLAVLRDNEVKSVALRAADLSTDSLSAIRVMIEQARRLEGIPDGDPRQSKGDPPHAT